MNKLLVATVALALPLAASAQTIWRCGPDGRSYSATPCTDGRSLEGMQPRPVDDLADAQQRAARERRDADAMTRERLAQENRQRGNGLAGFTPPQAAASAPQPRAKARKKQRLPGAADTWPAADPSSRRRKG